jgi:hypothetical protein
LAARAVAGTLTLVGVTRWKDKPAIGSDHPFVATVDVGPFGFACQ